MQAQTVTVTVRCDREIAGEYVTAGQTYNVQLGRREASFRRVDDTSGTFMPMWRYEQARRDGSLTLIAA